MISLGNISPGTYIKFRRRPFHMRNEFLAPSSIWALLPIPKKYPLFTSLLVEVTALSLRSQLWRLPLDGNNKMRRSIHRLVDTDLEPAQNLDL